MPYFRPGDQALGPAVEALAERHRAVLLANHGPVVAGTSLEAAVYAIEELEETAKLFLLLHGRDGAAADGGAGGGPQGALSRLAVIRFTLRS